MPRLLIAADIFGHTPEMQALARQISGQGGAVRVVSPYGDERPRFSGEMEAYAAFTARGGVERYAGALAAHLVNPGTPGSWDLAVGLSAGASALWIALAGLNCAPPRRSVLYYGSRIRQHTHLRPAGDIRLIFAEREAGFDPAALAAELAAAGYDARVLPGTAHGFMNPLSPGYDAPLCSTEAAWLAELARGSDAARTETA